MNIVQLLHNHSDHTISHWPIYIMSQSKRSWYFYSSKQVTLRKKKENTSLTSFLQSHNNKQKQGDQQSLAPDAQNYTVIQVRQIDHRQPKNTQLHKIKINKIPLQQILTIKPFTQQNLVREFQWRPGQYQQISLYKIQDIQHNRLYNIFWSNNIITCKAPINNHLRNKLTDYCELLCQKIQEKILYKILKVRQFQLIFTYDTRCGKIKILFANNFKLLANQNYCCDEIAEQQLTRYEKIEGQREMYWTDLKIGQDQYQEIQLLMEDNKDKPQDKPHSNTNQNIKQKEQQNQYQKLRNVVNEQNCEQEMDKIQQKRLRYIRTLQRLQNQQNEYRNKLKIALKKQAIPQQQKQYQCSSCYVYVKLNQFEFQRFVNSNRIPEIRMRRQVKMNKNMKGGVFGAYESVPVCQLCYNKYKQIVLGNDRNDRQDKQPSKQNKRLNSSKHKQKCKMADLSCLVIQEQQDSTNKQNKIKRDNKPISTVSIVNYLNMSGNKDSKIATQVSNHNQLAQSNTSQKQNKNRISQQQMLIVQQLQKQLQEQVQKKPSFSIVRQYASNKNNKIRSSLTHDHRHNYNSNTTSQTIPHSLKSITAQAKGSGKLKKQRQVRNKKQQGNRIARSFSKNSDTVNLSHKQKQNENKVCFQKIGEKNKVNQQNYNSQKISFDFLTEKNIKIDKHMSKHKYIKATEDRESRNSKTRDGSSKTSKHNTNSNSIANNNTNILDETDDLQTALYEYQNSYKSNKNKNAKRGNNTSDSQNQQMGELVVNENRFKMNKIRSSSYKYQLRKYI